ncbi:hypothetical protein [Umezawaea sp. NPDC059074]|uniref:hypothetical protein n=1 Tax=Umezawaea sp. NPDC059074 TaxID=3346716 RepID=UPI0036BD30C4
MKANSQRTRQPAHRSSKIASIVLCLSLPFSPVAAVLTVEVVHDFAQAQVEAWGKMINSITGPQSPTKPV